MITRRIGFLGAAVAAIVASGCSGAGNDKGSESAQLGDDLGEDVSCGGAGMSSSGVLSINVGATSHTLVVTPGNGVVKANGRTCVDSKGAAIKLSAVNAISVAGTGGAAETIVLDFSLGLPTGNLIKAVTAAGTTGITVDGGETGATTPDTVIIKGSSSADFVVVGEDVTTTGTEKTVLVSMTSAAQKTPAANIALKNLTTTTNAHLVFSLGGGNDTFNAVAKGQAAGGQTMTGAEALAGGVSVYGGAGDDNITGGPGDDILYGEAGNDTFVCGTAADGSDLIDGGGDSGDIVDYSGRTNPLYVDLESPATVASYWGADLRGLSYVTGDDVNLTVNAIGTKDAKIIASSGSYSSPYNTPVAIVAALNASTNKPAGTSFSLVGSRLVYTVPVVAGATKITCANGTNHITCVQLGLPTSQFTFKNNDIGNDGEAGEGDDVRNVAKVYGGAGNDVLVGNGGNNGTNGIVITLYGKAGQNVIAPGVLPAGKSAATDCPTDGKTPAKVLPGALVGGPANATTGTDYDWFDMGVAAGCPFTLTGGGGGYDIVDYSKRASSSSLTIKLDGKSYSGDLGATPAENDIIGADVNVVFAGPGADTIVGSVNTDYIFAGGGSDTVSGGAGDDYIWGGAGTDLLNGEAGNDTFYEGATYAVGATAVAPNDPLGLLAVATAAGPYWSIGKSLLGDSPGAGDDVINGGGSSDDGSVDKLDLREAAAAVTVILCRDTTTTTGKDSAATVTGPCSTYGISNDGATGSNNYINLEYVAGSTTANNTIIGTDNAETFEGGSGVDVLLGQGGSDTLYGFADKGAADDASVDKLCGGDGDDMLFAGAKSTIDGEGNMLLVAASGTLDISSAAQARTTGATCVGLAGQSGPNPSSGNLCVGPVGASGGTMTHCYK